MFEKKEEKKKGNLRRKVRLFALLLIAIFGVLSFLSRIFSTLFFLSLGIAVFLLLFTRKKKGDDEARRRWKVRLVALLFVFVFGVLAVATRPSVKLNGEYTDKTHVALYIIEYKKLPNNYITKKTHEVATRYGEDVSDKTIGGDTFENRERRLPVYLSYKECDIRGAFYNIDKDRGRERLVYTDDHARVFYTANHYKSFDEITAKDIYKTSNVFIILLASSAGVTVVVFFFTRKKEPAPKKDGDSQA